MKREDGITLVELLIVLSLIMLSFVLLLPGFIGMAQRMEASELKDQLKRDIYWALQYADVNHQLLVLTFQPLNHSYIISKDGIPFVKRKYGKQLSIIHNFKNHQIAFYADGTISAAGQVKIFQNDKHIYTLFLELYTGNIREEEH